MLLSQGLKANIFVGKRTLTVCILVIGALVEPTLCQVQGFAGNPDSALTQRGQDFLLYVPYWSEVDGLRSSVVLNNVSASPVTVHPALYNAVGAVLETDAIALAPREQRRVRIADWIAGGGDDDAFTYGSLLIRYTADDASFFGAIMTITDPSTSVHYDFPAEMPGMIKSSRMEGVWWEPALRTPTTSKLFVSNMTDTTATASVAFSGGRGGRPNASEELHLGPHETKAVDLSPMNLPASVSGNIRAGGISIRHSGEPGSVTALVVCADSARGFSSHTRFSDPRARASSTLVASHLMVGAPDLAGYSDGTAFASTAVLRNCSDEKIDVLPSLFFKSGGESHSLALRQRSLPPGSIKLIDVAAELKRGKFAGPVSGLGLVLTATGARGGLVAASGSYDSGGDHVFTTPFKDPADRANRSGSYPWTIEGDRRSVLHVRNTSDHAAEFVARIDYDGGSYELILQFVEPQQETAIDIRALRDNQVEGSFGRTLPTDLSRGRITWYEHGPEPLVGRLEEYSVAQKTATNFSCGGPNCPCGPDTALIFIEPGSVSGKIGNTGSFALYEELADDCGTVVGTYNITGSPFVTWASSNSAIVSLGFRTDVAQPCSLQGNGTANVNVQYQAGQFGPDPDTGSPCRFSRVPFFERARPRTARRTQARSWRPLTQGSPPT